MLHRLSFQDVPAGFVGIIHLSFDDVYNYIFIIKQNTHSDDLLVITEKEKHNRSGFLQTCNCIEAVNFLLLNYVIPVL